MKKSSYSIYLTALAAASLSSAQVIIDGFDDGFDGYDYTADGVFQDVATEWGAGNFIGNFVSLQEGGALNLFIGSSATDNAVILFIDSKPGGVNTITNNLITAGGEESTINNLGSSATEGMTFEAGFEADYAIRIYGNADQTEAFVNLYDLQTGQRSYVGEVATTPQSGGIINSIACAYLDLFGTAPDDYEFVDQGIEVALSLGAMGVPAGEQEVKFTAILVNPDSTFGSNQVLGPRTGVTTVMGEGLNTIDFSTEPGNQTITVTVQNNDNDGDNDPDATDPDDDNDDLLDTSEDGGGIYLSPTETGTNPLIADTDGDGYDDGDEVNNTSALGYQSDPNIPNYTVMTVPGDFNLPDPFIPDAGANDPSTDMTQKDTANLSDQYVWELSYQFPVARTIAFKFAAGSFATNWGAGATTGTVTRNGPDINAEITASGIHLFTFNQALLTYSLERVTFDTLGEYLAAYGLDSDPDGDDDEDTLSNSDEFVLNTDPTNPDTDGDGTNDNTDSSPLEAGSRDVVFSVNTRVIQKLGFFDPSTDTIRIVGDFWNAFSVADGPVLADPDEDGIYEATVTVSGRPGDLFGGYKFNTDSPTLPAAWNGFEQGDDRNFTLGAADTTQTLPTVYFNTANFGGNGIYYEWADDLGLDLTDPNSDPSANADGDGSSNREEFYFGSDPSTADTLPFSVESDGFDLIITWVQRTDGLVTYELQEAGDLSSWGPSESPNFESFDQSGVPFGYSRREAFIPIGTDPNFIQLEATATIPDPEPAPDIAFAAP